ncbi:acyl-CoA carboxylase subunit epsilon, partial [Plantactinospora mayteni]|uniref:acyl-CoA carboxylase subunit epsilon n=1 Tax=Plantactinospora mayteni TaxID=566021 RepID=UPI00194438FF
MNGADRQWEDVPAWPKVLVHGNATPEQLAAVMVVLAGTARTCGPALGRTSVWGERGRPARQPSAPGPDAWRRSALPR